MLTRGAEVFRFLAISHLVLVLALLIRDQRKDRSALVTAGFALSVLGYLAAAVLQHHEVPRLWIQPFFVAAFSVPFTFWLLAKVHFEDDFRIRALHWLILLCLLVASYLSLLAELGSPSGLSWLRRPSKVFWTLVPKILGGGLVVHALYRVYDGARSDLIEWRLKLRYVFLGLSGGYVLAVIVGEFLLAGNPVARTADTVNAGAIYLLVLVFSFVFTHLGTRFLKGIQDSREPASPELLARFDSLMSEQQVYREQGLTIGKLARHLSEYEYKVRQLINSDLGFKNFNAFIHHFRVRDACQVLKDPSQDGRAIAEIAYELGYQSLGPFNKAFKAITGSTPSEFRKSSRQQAS